MKRLITFLTVSAISLLVFSQGGSSITDVRNVFDEKGDYYFERQDYKKAIVYYNMAYKKDARNYYSVMRKAEAYTALELNLQAAECYKIIFNTDLRIPNNYRLEYALILMKIGNIPGFEEWMAKYNEVVASDMSGLNYISSKDDRAKLYKDSSIVFVVNETEINTPQSEINPVAYDNQLYFSSNRKDVSGSVKNAFYNLYSAGYSGIDGQLSNVTLFNSSLNTAQNEGSLCFFDVTNTMYFSRSNANFGGMKTYETSIPYEKNEKLEALSISMEGMSNFGQVTLSSSGTEMYFVSDAAGGKGGFDIYKSTLVGADWTKPENLAAINTSGNELFPFIQNDTMLYFSSNGHNGKGGLDIYSVNLNDPSLKVFNLGIEVNTSANEYGLTLSQDGRTGYFCSNRPGGMGLEDIYRLHKLDLQVRYSYHHKVHTKMEDDKINLYLTNGDEYNIADKSNEGFKFAFQPEEPYLMVIQKENTNQEDAISNTTLSASERSEKMLKPDPLDRAEIPLEPGMKFVFTAGAKGISQDYMNELNSLAGTYQDPNTSTIDLTALAKELQFTEGEQYTIRFIRDKHQATYYKSKGESSLFINDEPVSVFGQSFFIVVPLDKEVQFNIQTDLTHLKENFNPKKVSVVVETGAIFKDESNPSQFLISLLVNTERKSEVPADKRITASDISIVPGSAYIMTLAKKLPETNEEVEIIVPLTKGLRYNIGQATSSKEVFKKRLTEMLVGRSDLEPTNEELIDISVLSKSLEIKEGEKVRFNLVPARTFGKNANAPGEPSMVMLDGKAYELAKGDKLVINMPFDVVKKMNIQSDLDYILENMSPEDFIMALDTVPCFEEDEMTDDEIVGREESEWVSVSVNTEEKDEVEKANQLIAKELSIIPGKEYILTVTKVDGETKKETEIIVPLTRRVKYDFTSNPVSEEAYKQSLDKFLKSQAAYETTGGELIDISLLSKELEIKEGDLVSFSLLPAKVFKDGKIVTEASMSNLYLDKKVVEFTQLQKYTINIPIDDNKVNINTDLEQVQETFEPGTFSVDLDTIGFFFEIEVDTAGFGYLVQDEEISDPVFDVVIINFDLDSYELRSQAVYTLDGNVIEELKKDSRLYVTIKGYTDGLGNAEYNKRLSKNRAQAVKDYLTLNGIGENRIRTFSFGAEKTLEDGISWEDLSEKELEKHRRVEIVLYLPE